MGQEREGPGGGGRVRRFYRKAHLRWIDATKRRPDQRPVRIAEVVALLEDHQKQRPGT